MKKCFLAALALAFLLFSATGPLSAGDVSPSKSEPKAKSGQVGRKVSPVALELINSAPAATGKTMFELASTQVNRWIDERYGKLAKAERPYVSPLTLARAADSLVKNYRAGDKLILTEIAKRIPYDLTVAEKVDILEKVTRAYLDAEAKKK